MKPYLLNPMRRLSTHTQLRASRSPSDLLPPGLQVNSVLPLANTVPPYAKHVVISTGRSNWGSQIVAEKGPNMAKDLKELLGLGGEFHNVRICFLTTAPSEFIGADHVVKGIPINKTGVRTFAREFLVPGKDSTESPSSDGQSCSNKQEGIPSDDVTKIASRSVSSLFKVSSISQLIVLICGHMERDKRCGIYGPILVEEFNKHLPPTANPIATIVSHIGGHHFAGNLIIYIPPDFTPTLGRFAPSSAGVVKRRNTWCPANSQAQEFGMGE